MNVKVIGVLLLALMFLVSPVIYAQMMGDGMMKGGQMAAEGEEEGQMPQMPMMHGMINRVMEMMQEMMEGMRGMAQDEPTKEKMDGMMMEMDEMIKQHEAMMEGMMSGSMMGRSDEMKPVEKMKGTMSSATQKNSGGGVTVEATLLNPKDIDERVTFSLKFDTHSVNLDEYDLANISHLRDDLGRELHGPVLEKAEGSGHHRSAIISFSNKNDEGMPIFTPETKYIELAVNDVAGVVERTFRWEIVK